MRPQVASMTIVALLLASGPVSLAGLAAQGPPVLKRAPERRSLWPSGTIEEVWHGTRSMSLRLAGGRHVVQIDVSGDAFYLDMQVTIDGETRAVDYAALVEALSRAAATVTPSRATPEDRSGAGNRHDRSAGEIDNADVLAWIERKAGAAFTLPDVDRAHFDERLLEATLEKGACAGRVRAALRATGSWLACIAIAAATAGSALPYCFLLGVGAYFLAYAALEECHHGANDSLDCDCAGIAPDCMCCELEPGDFCTCHCPGEACCDWEDARRLGR